MAASAARLPNGWVLSIETPQIAVTSFSPRPDPHWTYTDAAGHEHRADYGMEYGRVKWVSYPTLQWVDEESYWCPDCQDEHTRGHYECPDCREWIVPGTKTGSMFADYLPGETTIRLVGPNQQEIMLTAEEAADIQTRGAEAATEIIEQRGVRTYGNQ